MNASNNKRKMHFLNGSEFPDEQLNRQEEYDPFSFFCSNRCNKYYVYTWTTMYELHIYVYLDWCKNGNGARNSN